MKNNILHRVYEYIAVFEPDKVSGGFTATIPALPGCISEGETFEEATRNIKEAASLYIEVMHQEKFEAPDEEKEFIIAPVEIKV